MRRNAMIAAAVMVMSAAVVSAPASHNGMSVTSDNAFRGKTRAPGRLAPATKEDLKEDRGLTAIMRIRDPFDKPTEVLPSECPPSMPLCRFTRSQLKLVGVIQVADGVFKGMVEDPDGRGYFIAPGMQIGGATVTQITSQGATLREHAGRRDVPMPLFKHATGF